MNNNITAEQTEVLKSIADFIQYNKIDLNKTSFDEILVAYRTAQDNMYSEIRKDLWKYFNPGA